MTTSVADSKLLVSFVTRRLAMVVAFCLLATNLSRSLLASENAIVMFRGPTMGTSYSVKVFPEPGLINDAWVAETDSAIEKELRIVNDQMSTYLKSSEISRFNDDDSLGWFTVSSETAAVVDFALTVSVATRGVFDVTVGPLVDRWSFGTGDRRRDVPTDGEIALLLEHVGYQKLHARLDPPAIKKDVTGLRVDLSAIAKGHGVDRIVDLLASRGANNVFVEIGGEVRVAGSKGGDPWMVGIQQPDSEAMRVFVAHPLTDSAMATSGDYRNYFTSGGERYSHTIDPRIGRPVKRSPASVSVIAPTCMAADAWATALMATPIQSGESAARANQLSALLITREVDQWRLIGTGELAEYAGTRPREAAASVMERAAMIGQVSAPNLDEAEADQAASTFAERFLPVAIITALGLGTILTAMAVGVLFGRRSISGSCGGLNARTDPDGTSRCAVCSNPSTACKELRDAVGTERREPL